MKEQYTTKFEQLFELVQVLNRLNDFDEILRVLTEKITLHLQADATIIMMLNPDTQRTLKTARHMGSLDSDKNIRNLKMQVTGWMSHHESSLLSEDILSDTRFPGLDLENLDIKSIIATMIRMESEEIGSIIVYKSTQKSAFSPADLDILEKASLISAPYIQSLEQRRKYFKPEVADVSLIKKYQDVGLLGQSTEFIELLHIIEAAARCDVRVVLEGQTGTGKELIAKAIHKFSERRSRPFVAIDCGAIPENIIESELFGYKRGAFTGANQDRKGLLEEAHTGTLFMDEIANLPYNVQAKFMRFLQEGEIRPLGSNQSKKVDVRIISASSRSLFKMVEEEKFREDLYFRLHVYPVPVPSLNERAQDIPVLATYFLIKIAKQQNKTIQSLGTDLQNYLQQRQWRGNIRELVNFIERVVTTAPDNVTELTGQHLPPDLQKDFQQTVQFKNFETVDRSLDEHIKALETRLIRQALSEHEWNQSKAARVLNIAEHTMRYKMKRLGIMKPMDKSA